MIPLTRKLNLHLWTFVLLLSWGFLFSSDTHAETTKSEASISLAAKDLPEFKTDPFVKESQGNQISGVVRRMFQDRGGNLWFATQNGVSRYDGASLTYFDIRDKFGGAVTGKSFVEDKEGNLWLGTTGGLTRYDGSYFTTFTDDDGLCDNDVWSMLVDSSGTIWIGTLGGVCKFDGTTFTPFPIPAATERDYNRGVWSPTVVWDITEDRAGNMWFVASAGVYKHDGETLQRVPVMEQDSETHVTSISEDRSGNLWFSTYDKGLIRFDGETFTNLTQQEGLSGLEVGDAYEDSSGNIWFPAEDVGLYRYDGTSVTGFSAKHGLAGRPFSVFEDRDERLWCVGLMGAYRLDGEAFVNVTRDGPW